MPKKKKSSLITNLQNDSIDVRYVPIDSVYLWDDNPRNNEAAVRPLSKILQKFGQRSPIVVWSKNNVIYKGNTTWKAMKLLGAKEIKVQFENFSNLKSAVAYGIADNKTNEFSDWNDDILRELLSAEEFEDVKLDLGFSEQELNGLFMESDLDQINNLTPENSGINGIIKIKCNPNDLEDIREVLRTWAEDCGFDDVEVK